LTNLGSAPYSVTKHAAVALAEWLSITHGDEGLEVFCLCPQGVRTPLLEDGLAAGDPAARAVLLGGGLLDAAEVAATAVAAVEAGTFMILPHPEVATYARWRAEDPTRWLKGMRRAWAQVRDEGPPADAGPV
jgi:NAD(P)-dependent dehydrogenase (short-subunit alcohol dehydrogenase family)